MSENTANAGHDNGPTICFGIARANKKAEISMPPECAYAITAITVLDEDCLVLPLESNQRKGTKSNPRKENPKQRKVPKGMKECFINNTKEKVINHDR